MKKTKTKLKILLGIANVVVVTSYINKKNSFLII